MNKDDLIYAQIQKLQAGNLSPQEKQVLAEQMAGLSDKERSEIQEEMDFVSFMWGKQPLDDLEQPSPGYANKFFESLDAAKVTQQNRQEQGIKESIWEKFSRLLGLDQPVWRFAAIGHPFRPV